MMCIVSYLNDRVTRAYEAVVMSVLGNPDCTLLDIVSGPVQLSVGTGTRLLLNITRDFNSTRHVFNLKLLHGSAGVGGRIVELRLNETAEYSSPQTDQTGQTQIVLWPSPQQRNEQVNFNVVASFGGDGTSLAKTSHTLPNGTMYDVCTTIQYNGFKPSSNSTSILVWPQKTEGETTLMNQEQMQKKAQERRWMACKIL